MTLAAGAPRPAAAIPVFATQYGVTCQKCHTVVPRLTAFGQAFLASGDRIPGLAAGPAFPVAVKVNLAASSEGQGSGPGGAGLPKAIVDEIEAFTSGTIGSRGSYFVEQYIVDGGEHGALRDAWVNERLNPWSARIPLSVQAGSFTLPLPVDPETFRETYEHYALFDQTAGTNPFNFFDPKVGVRLAAGDALHGVSAQAFTGPGHDRQSGLPATGTDAMVTISDAIGPVVPSVYRYTGVRRGSTGMDGFSRTGYGLVASSGRWTSESVFQTGWDANLSGAGASSSGGFTQLRCAFNARTFALARYEGTNDPGGFARSAVVLVGYRPARNARLTAEDVIRHAPQTRHTLNVQMTVAY